AHRIACHQRHVVHGSTFTHWSFLGQLVILCLIQVGGIGFMTVIISISTGLGHKIGLHERQLLVESSGL
ncbi:hypothetical protein FDW96_02940, partial [Citrobacter sp. TBCS-15]